MGYVDFSNAVLEVYNSEKPLTGNNYLRLYHRDFFDISTKQQVNRGQGYDTYTIITNTPSKVSILYTGEFTRSGNGFFIGYSTTSGTFTISNISYSAGDNYSFIIDIETSGNT